VANGGQALNNKNFPGRLELVEQCAKGGTHDAPADQDRVIPLCHRPSLGQQTRA
jgi:hypothetical protein